MHVVSFSALEYWQRVRPIIGLSVQRNHPRGGFVARQYRPARVAAAQGRPPSDAEVRRWLAGRLAGLSMPLHLGVRDASLRRPSRLKTCHVIPGPLPAGAFVRVADGLLVATPEYALVQVALECSLYELVWLAYGLCGTYAPNLGDGGAALYGVAPVTEAARIERFAAAARGTGGAEKMLRAARFALDHSASPTETALAMLLTLPYALGGYGLPRPEMNRWVTPGKARRGNVGQTDYCCDVFWADKGLALEYDGEEAHAGMERIAHDAARRNDLEYLDVTVLPVTKWQLYRADRFDRLARQVAGKLGVRLRMSERSFDWRRRQEDLRAFLLQGENRFDAVTDGDGSSARGMARDCSGGGAGGERALSDDGGAGFFDFA